MEDDILKIFQHIKSLLNIDYKVSENESSMISLKSQVNQMRNAVNDLSDYVSKLI